MSEEKKIEVTPSKASALATRVARPAEWGIAGSAGLALAETTQLQGGPDWLPVVSGIVSLILRLLPVFFR
jgi:hypothetical protein